MDYSHYKCICGGMRPIEIRRGPVYKCDPAFEFALLACIDCGLGMLWPPLSAAERRAVSGRRDDAQLHRPRLGRTRTRSRLHVRRLSKTLLRSLVASELPAGSRVLDVGCGDGDLAVELAGVGFQVTGIDLAPAPMEVLARHGVAFKQTTFEEFEPEGGRFDGIIISHTLEHLPDPGLALRRAKGLLAPSGRLFIELPNLDRPGTSVRRLCSVQHLWYFTPESLSHHLRLAGLRPLFERVFRVDCFQTVAGPALEGARLPSPDPARAERTAAIIRRHRWLYYARLQFLWRKMPYLRRAIYFPFPKVRRPRD